MKVIKMDIDQATNELVMRCEQDGQNIAIVYDIAAAIEGRESMMRIAMDVKDTDTAEDIELKIIEVPVPPLFATGIVH